MKNLLIISVTIHLSLLSACETREVAPVYESQAAFRLHNLSTNEWLPLEATGEENTNERFFPLVEDASVNQSDSVVLIKTVGYAVPYDSTRYQHEHLQLTFLHKEDRNHLIFINEQQAVYRRPEDLRERFLVDRNTTFRVDFWQTYLFADVDGSLQDNQHFNLTRVKFLEDAHGVYLEADLDAVLNHSSYQIDPAPIFAIQGHLSAHLNDTIYVNTY